MRVVKILIGLPFVGALVLLELVARFCGASASFLDSCVRAAFDCLEGR